jgi:FkbM family methyltransferase
MIRVIANSDPPEIDARLWQGWSGELAFYVGANAGQHFAKLTATFSRIFAFEPNPDSVEVARHIAEQIRPRRVDVMQLAISDHDGKVQLANLIGTRQEATGQWVTPGTAGMEWDPGQDAWYDPNKVQLMDVPCATLDSLSMSLGPPDFVCIDTEGHEWKIFQGAGRVLTDVRPGFLIEFHTPENHDNIRRVLDGHGYWTETIRHPHYPPHTLMWYQHGWLRAKPFSQTENENEASP